MKLKLKMKYVLAGVATISSGSSSLVFAADMPGEQQSSMNLMTDGTCMKSGVGGNSATKSACDSIGGSWHSRGQAQAVGAANGRGDNLTPDAQGYGGLFGQPELRHRSDSRNGKLSRPEHSAQ